MFEYLCAFLDHMIKPLSGKNSYIQNESKFRSKVVFFWFKNLAEWLSTNSEPALLVEFSVFSQRNTVAGLVGFQEEMRFLLL